MEGPSSSAGLMKVAPGKLRITHLNRVRASSGVRLFVWITFCHAGSLPLRRYTYLSARRLAACASGLPFGPVFKAGCGTGRYGGHRMRPVTGATGRGSSARRAGSRPKGRDENCRTAYGALPALTAAAYGGPLWPLITPPVGSTRYSRFMLRPSGVAPKVRP